MNDPGLVSDPDDPESASSTPPCFLAALDAALIPMWLTAGDANGTYFNKAWLEFTGQTMEQEVNGGWKSGIHPDDLAKIPAHDVTPDRRGLVQVEYRLLRHDGVWRWILDTCQPRFGPDGEHLGYIGTCIDITDRVDAETALRCSEARLQLAQTSGGAGSFDWDILAERLAWSPQMFGMFGIDPQTRAEDLVAHWRGCVHPEDRHVFDAALAGQIDTCGENNFEFRILHHEKGERHIESRGSIHRDADGRPVRMIGLSLDVTEQRRAELARHESEQRLRDITENFPGIIFRRISFPDGRIEYPYFSGTGDIFGVRRSVFAGTHQLGAPARHIHYDDNDDMVRRFKDASAHLSPLELLSRIIDETGETRWIRSLSRPRPRDDGALIWDGVLLDVTAEHIAEAERQRSSAMLRMSMELAGIGTWEYDPSTQTVMASDTTDRIFGIADDRASRPLDDYMQTLHPDDRDEIRRDLEDGRCSDSRAARELRLLLPDGTIRWVTSQAACVSLANGDERVIGALFDITVRKMQENARDAALHHQETLLKELNHRVKNNLQLIVSMLRLQASRSPATPQSFASAISRVEAISDLHSQLNSIGGARQIDFAAHLRKLSDKLRQSVLDDSAITLHCDVATCVIDLDLAVPLGLVVNELVTNAIKYAFPDNRQGTIRITLCCKADDAMTVTVSDDGAGFAERSENSSGLGTRLVSSLGNQIGATIVRGDGGGTTYTITVPHPPTKAADDAAG